MGFREDLKVNKIEKKPNKKMMEKIEARKSRNCPEYDGDER